MKKTKICCWVFVAVWVLMNASVPILANETGYTYFYDYWDDERESPDTYRIYEQISGEDFDIGAFKNAQSIYVRNDFIYVCDTGNNRIVVLKNENYTFSLVQIIDTFTVTDDTVNTFEAPNDIFVNDKGELYICDTQNQRVLHLSSELSLVQVFERPEDNTVNTDSDFFPLKVVVDDGGRLFVLAKNYNKGFVQFKPNGEFAGYMGANEVKFNLVDYMWKLVSTKEQRAQMEQFVPTEYNNLALDSRGFIYCTTSVFDEDELRSDQAKPIRKLNAVGADILVKNGTEPPIGELIWSNVSGISGPSRMVDITVLDNDIYFALDKVRGRLFSYDSQGNLLYAFGGLGNRQGYFQYPVAVEHMANDLLVLDENTGYINYFVQTEYGMLITKALKTYEEGDYDQATSYWNEVLTYNGNYDMAYIGLGRSYLRQKDYTKAMEYFKLKNKDALYSKAFMLERKDWIEEHIGKMLLIMAVLILIPLGIKGYKRIKREVETYERDCI